MEKEEISKIDLGFAEEEPKLYLLSNRYFPSKIGGKPAWLDLKNLPQLEDLKCGGCAKPKVLLCQIYAPNNENENAFHRTIFIFVCRTESCYQINSNENITVLRSQLNRENSFYSFDPPDESQPLTEIPTEVKICLACGCRGPLTCSRCKKVNYCGVDHQKFDWKQHKLTCNSDDVSSNSDLTNKLNYDVVFPQYKIIIEPEDEQENDDDDDGESENDEQKHLEEYEKLVADGKDGILKDVSETELMNYAQADTDVQFKKFKKRISESSEQILRYERNGEPLWITEMSNEWQTRIMNCENCGETRQFEFQIMPQMLNYLNDDSIDWGVLAIFTCRKSCDINGYVKEFVIKQDIVK